MVVEVDPQSQEGQVVEVHLYREVEEVAEDHFLYLEVVEEAADHPHSCQGVVEEEGDHTHSCQGVVEVEEAVDHFYSYQGVVEEEGDHPHLSQKVEVVVQLVRAMVVAVVAYQPQSCQGAEDAVVVGPSGYVARLLQAREVLTQVKVQSHLYLA